MTGDPVVDLGILASELVAAAWILHVPFIIVWGHYMRDRGQDNESNSDAD